MAKGRFFKNRQDMTRAIVLIFVFGVIILFLAEIVLIPLAEFNGQDVSRINSGSGGQEDYAKKFNATWVFDNLTQDEKNYILSQGNTLAVYNYTDAPGFFELEGIVNQFGGQVILERSKSEKREIMLQSMRDTTTIENITTQNIFAGLCDVLEYPPPDCTSLE
jgi:hypothetical protein